MIIRRSYLEMIKAFPGGWDAVAPALGFTRDSLENRIYERKGQGILVQTALQIQSFSSTTKFAEAVCAASGGAFVKLPEHAPMDNESIGKKFRELSIRIGDLAKRYDEATADDVIDKRERVDLEALAGAIHRTVEELMSMSFRVFCPDDSASDSGK